MTTEILLLLLALQLKHLIADYYLQFQYMYENKGKEKGWFFPLFEHSGVHAGFTFIILWVLGIFRIIDIEIETVIVLSLFDWSTHFAIDRWKATQKDGPDTDKFWQYLGIDQMLHHIVGILIVWQITQIGI
ncbi:MAG: DUF3307 domain-containing protein [Bacteroidales bacterium]|nr:DUF3307 domain-containing protein [Bacteroidales bacterium]